MEICLQSGGIIEHVDTEKGYQWIARAGFTCIDWTAIEHGLKVSQIKSGEWRKGCVYDKPLEETVAHFFEEYEIIQGAGLKISQAHAPFPCYSAKDPDLFPYMLGVYQRMIQVCQHYKVPRVVVHGISQSRTDPHTAAQIEELNWQLYESMIPALRQCPDVTVCLENLFSGEGGLCEGHCSDAHEAVRFIDTLNEKAGRQAFGLCLDTGHLHLLHKNFRTYIATLGDRIVALHIHDNDGNADRHMAPLTGTVPWKHFLDGLKEIGYCGDLSFETFAQSRAALFMDEELLLPWLHAICKTGESFRKYIQA